MDYQVWIKAPQGQKHWESVIADRCLGKRRVEDPTPANLVAIANHKVRDSGWMVGAKRLPDVWRSRISQPVSMPQQLPQISIRCVRYPDPGKAVLHHEPQQ